MTMRGLIVALMAGMAGVPQVAGPVVLAPVAEVAHGVAAFPRIAGGVDAGVTAKVNAGLKRLDVSVAAAALDCRKSFREQTKKSGSDAWTRTVEVTMRGPRYVSYLATDSYFCGGMYPNDGIVLPLVYDLTTGIPVDWLKYLPAGAKGALSNSGDGAKTGVVMWPVLSAMAKRQADDKDCKEAYGEDGEPVQFALWLDARAGAVEAQAVSFPHAMAACADVVTIPADAARKMGFGAELVDALEAAKKLQK